MRRHAPVPRRKEPITRIGWFITGTLFGGTDRRSDLRRGMEETLRKVAAAAEEEPTARAGA